MLWVTAGVVSDIRERARARTCLFIRQEAESSHHLTSPTDSSHSDH